MDEDHRLFAERKRKLEELRELGINPYPYNWSQTHHAKEIKTLFDGLEEEEPSGQEVAIAGRIMLYRHMGKLAFMQVQDETGRIQCMFRKDLLEENWKLLKKYDMGDFIGCKGEVIKTRTGEITVLVHEFRMLCKSLRPLPEKYHGLKDEELRFRKRYLDLAVNPEVKDIFMKRAKVIKAVRDVLEKRGFLEVETPTLQVIHGGANARPFETHINAWNMKMYLSIAPELYLKRLLVGGFEKVYTICKNFRNEGVDQTHNPEFTMMECYQAYVDYEEMMAITEDCYAEACKAINGSTKVVRNGVEIDFTPPWQRVTVRDAIQEHGQIEVDALSDDELLAEARKHDLEVDKDSSRGQIIIELFEHFAEEKLIQPVHIIEHPIESTPLCKTTRDGSSDFIERFESFALGTELSNAYTELNDPLKQRELFEAQVQQAEAGDEEAHPMDEDFLQAMEHGMPIAGGLGIGIDRMVIFLTGSEGIRDVILFPTMRPEGHSVDSGTKSLDIRVGKITSVKKHKDAENLFIEEVDFGEKKIQVVSSLVGIYSEKELVGKTALFLTNLKATKFKGVVSEGMILCAGEGDDWEVLFAHAPPGTVVSEGTEEIILSDFAKHKLKTVDGALHINGEKILVTGKPVTVKKFGNAKVR